ncbi:MAG: HlyD family efflux transporter periplasmic adaptor subunit [Deltaproteobacteria bacterium]|nr:HlyD family efflux transporter periplasmic adaptor subunit [Deltaproteobacteria bacterium]
MGLPFSQTLVAFDAERSNAGALVWLGAGLTMVTAWIAWLVLASVSVSVVSESARIEQGSLHPVSVTTEGRIVALHLELGQQVDVGDVLVELDADVQRRDLARAEARVRIVQPQLAALEAQIEQQHDLLPSKQRSAARALAAASARQSEMEVARDLAEAELTRVLAVDQFASPQQRDRARSAAARAQARLRAAHAEHGRAEHMGTADADTIRVELRRLERERARLQGQAQTAAANVELARAHVERRSVRSTVRGRVVSLSETAHEGGGLALGETIATILERGGTRVTATISPASVGRVHPGMAARVHLDAFPWIQYGTLDATVHTVATEVVDDTVRIELSLDPPAAGSPIPVQHGLAGTVEIEVETTTPAVLLGRLVGRGLHPPTSTTNTESPR